MSTVKTVRFIVFIIPASTNIWMDLSIDVHILIVQYKWTVYSIYKLIPKRMIDGNSGFVKFNFIALTAIRSSIDRYR